MTEAAPTPDDARSALAALRVRVAAEDVHLAERGRGWIAWLPEGRLAWFADSDAARAMLARERRVLGVVAARCRADLVPVPRVLAAAPDGGCDVRTAMPGTCDPLWLVVIVEWGTWGRSERDALRLGARALGAAVELHYRDAPLDVLCERVRRRGMEDPPITREALAGWRSAFQVPTSEELGLFDPPLVADDA